MPADGLFAARFHARSSACPALRGSYLKIYPVLLALRNGILARRIAQSGEPRLSLSFRDAAKRFRADINPKPSMD
jgi:hypothetical protein